MLLQQGKRMIHELNIKLGHRCMFQCSYCLSEGLIGNKDYTIDKELYNFIEHSEIFNPENLVIKFFGGESLIYFGQIKEIIHNLKNKPRFRFIIFSNGQLLSEEIIIILNKYNIEFILSHDGHNTSKTRTCDVLADDEKFLLFKQIKNKKIYMVYNRYNQDLYTAWNYFQNLFGNIPIETGLIVPTEKIPEDIYDFNLNIVKETFEKVKQKILQYGLNNIHTQNETNFVRDRLIFLTQVELGHIKDYENSCHMMHSRLSIDSEGYLLSCHNAGSRVADKKIFQMSFSEMSDIFYMRYQPAYTFETCSSCKYNKYCRGSCFTKQNLPAMKKLCDVKHLYYDMLVSFLKKYKGKTNGTSI